VLGESRLESNSNLFGLLPESGVQLDSNSNPTRVQAESHHVYLLDYKNINYLLENSLKLVEFIDIIY